VPPTVLLELWVHSYAGTYRWRAQLVAARFYRLGKRYTRASLTQPEAVDLLTGQPAGPVTEQQKSDAAKGMEMLR
jgi:sRNA-binding protein